MPLYDAAEVAQLLRHSLAAHRAAQANDRCETATRPGGQDGEAPKTRRKPKAVTVHRLLSRVQVHPSGALDKTRLSARVAAGYLGMTTAHLESVPDRHLPFTRSQGVALYLVRDLEAYEERSHDQ